MKPGHIMAEGGQHTICSLCGAVVPPAYQGGYQRGDRWLMGKGPAWEAHLAFHKSLESK